MPTVNLREQFEAAVKNHIHRDGIDDLMNWLANTDFYTSPASTKYHGAFEGGLALHSLNVFHQLVKLCKWYGCDATDESIAIVALFHDLCKVGTYKTELRWRKNANNQWEQYSTYTRNEDFKFGGHGSKSVYLVQNFMKLSPEEAASINCHMGQWEATQYGHPNEVYEESMLAWLLHVADEADAYVVSKEM